VDPAADHAADNVYLLGFKLWQGRTKFRVEMKKYICACIITFVINVSCIALTLYSTSAKNISVWAEWLHWGGRAPS
jgi:hypothetical protein